MAKSKNGRRAGHNWRKKRRLWEATGQDARRQEVLGWLRDAFAEREFALIAWRNILGYLASLGLRNRVGKLPTYKTACVWKRELRMPVLAGCRGIPGRRPSSPPFTTNFLIQAWLASLFCSGGPYPILIERPAQVSAAEATAPKRRAA